MLVDFGGERRIGGRRAVYHLRARAPGDVGPRIGFLSVQTFASGPKLSQISEAAGAKLRGARTDPGSGCFRRSRLGKLAASQCVISLFLAFLGFLQR